MKAPALSFSKAPVKFRMPTSANLVPIRLDIEIDGQRFKDAFTWNPSDGNYIRTTFISFFHRQQQRPLCSSCHTSSSFCASIQSNNSARFDLSTDLRLGLSISSSYYNDLFPTPTTTTRVQPLSLPPIRSILCSAHLDKALDHKQASLYIKIYMEGIPIGRKLNLFAQDGYDSLITTVARMFPTTILCPGADRVHSDKYHALTYEDKEGDWMMVGDVPWEMFLNNVKRLKITRADRC